MIIHLREIYFLFGCLRFHSQCFAFCFLFLCLLRTRSSNSFIFLYFHFIAVMKSPQTKLMGSTLLKGFISSLLLTVLIFLFSLFTVLFLKSQIRCLISVFLWCWCFACSQWKALVCILCWSIDCQWQIHPLTSWCDTHSPPSVMLTLNNSERVLWNMNFQGFVHTALSVLGALPWVRQQCHRPRRWPAAARGGGGPGALLPSERELGKKRSGVSSSYPEKMGPQPPEFSLSSGWTASSG